MKDIQINNRSLAVYKRAYSIWQKTPHPVAPMSETWHTCQSCALEFQGNFCPRCGQSASVGRFSIKKAFLLFLDIWGIGNRGMFHSIRDLMLRPGYMIRDYISGCQSAYIPPYKMFFILATFSLLLTNGFNFILDEEKLEVQEHAEKSLVEMKDHVKSKITQYVLISSKAVLAFQKKNPALFGFFLLLFISAPLYLFLRHCPALPDLRYSEHVVALVYTSNMYSCYQLLAGVMPFEFLSTFLEIVALIMIFVALSQLTGYSKKRLLWYFTLTFLLFFLAFLAIITIVVLIIIQSEQGFSL